MSGTYWKAVAARRETAATSSVAVRKGEFHVDQHALVTQSNE